MIEQQQKMLGIAAPPSSPGIGNIIAVRLEFVLQIQLIMTKMYYVWLKNVEETLQPMF